MVLVTLDGVAKGQRGDGVYLDPCTVTDGASPATQLATNARTLDVELEAIRDLLGHRDIRTTLIYAKVIA
ncbi:MAG: hypothetical protein WDM89_19470 [Rhizomicrobium sp.]